MTDPYAAEDTRSYILQRAGELFGTRGYRGFSMRELAEACGLAKATLYYHFPSKRELYLRVLEMEALALQDALTEAAGRSGTIPERIGYVAYAYFNHLVRKQYLFHIAVREGGSFEDIRQVIATHRESIMAPLVSLVDAGIEAGTLRPMDSQLMARTLFGMMNALITYQLTTEGAEPDPNAFADTLLLFLEGAVVRSRLY